MASAPGLRLAIVGGGTGGHVVPGMHLLGELVAGAGDLPSLADLLWFETGRRAEVESMKRLEEDLAGVALERVRLTVEPPGGGAPGKGRLVARTPAAFWRARRALSRHRSELLFGLGGFTLLPAVLAARSLGIPVALLEINAQPGRAVRFLTPLAQRVYHAWSASLPKGASAKTGGGAPGPKHQLTGPPLPPGLDQAGDPRAWEQRVEGRGPLLAVLGGSQGALALNDFVRASIDRWSAAGLRVVHQVGPGRLDEAAALRPGYLPLEFVDDVPGLLRAATLVLCRAGASTLAEVAALGVPAIAVPYPGAGGHQRDNAAEFGSALRLVEEPELGPGVADELLELAGEAGRDWRTMSAAELRERVPVDSSRRILGDLVELVRGR
ncbi:MAG: UDP-N-acetylglucosamine--N-acetylmuramyl-(pentapeptide) pyrophosphoryl-undecaprenol N-acetylglucosamine transferase [Planctomycetota bacterium]|nr:UDP-N-acetylglucosamine--N-acetylmuramyl-(pentapeptide) pyrophosphoryl-undecaprenol N-acetylglucosamine transferase [Planctomycetota bacterium]